MFRIINTSENFGHDEWFTNEADIIFETEEEAEIAVNHLNAEWDTDAFEAEEA